MDAQTLEEANVTSFWYGTWCANDPASRIRSKFDEIADVEEIAALRIQAQFRGWLGRSMTRRLQVRAEQRRIEDAHDLEQHRQRQAAAALNAETKKLGIENQRDAKLRAHRERRCAMELMCQGLRCSSASWEEDSTTLMSLLDGEGHWESWLGQHTSARPARKQYLSLARRWHPDKWVRQGDACVAIATEVTKSLVQAYEQAMRALPTESVETGDDDDEREVYEFASWVGICFDGMFDVWRERKGVGQ